MSVHNGEAYLKACIDSILGQTFDDFEFIIVDDASADATAVLLDEYTRADIRVRLVTNKENLGLTKSLNIAIRKAQGEYIARMDADDISFPERFEKQVDFLDKNPEYGVVGAWAKVIDEKGEIIDEFAWETDSKTLKRNLIKWNPIIHSLAMIRKSVLDDAGLYDENFRYAQDYELWFRISRLSKMANIPDFLMSYRVSGKSITSSKNHEQAKCYMRAQWRAIKSGQYSPLNAVYLIRSSFSILFPPNIKKGLKKLYK